MLLLLLVVVAIKGNTVVIVLLSLSHSLLLGIVLRMKIINFGIDTVLQVL